MTQTRWFSFLTLTVAATLVINVGLWTNPSAADEVVLKDGRVYRGMVDEDEVVTMISDPLRRVFIRKTKIARHNPMQENWTSREQFTLTHEGMAEGGSMPTFSMLVDAEPWDKNCQRKFSHIATRTGKRASMLQAIHILGPQVCEIRGIEKYWLSKCRLSEIPRDVITNALKQIRESPDHTEESRKRVALFYLEAEWYDEAVVELTELAKDYPASRDQTEQTRQKVIQLKALNIMDQADQRLANRQPKTALNLLKTMSLEELIPERLDKINQKRLQLEAVKASDELLSENLRLTFGQLESKSQETWNKAYFEVMMVLTEASDTIRDRLAPFAKAVKSAQDGAQAHDSEQAAQQFALAMSGYLAGAEFAEGDLDRAWRLWEARDLVRDYLTTKLDSQADSCVDLLQTKKDITPAIVTAIVQKMRPPLSRTEEKPEVFRMIRVDGASQDENDPVEYGVWLPPEYHPLRYYPTILALHSGKGPRDAVETWRHEASKRGYIVIAPEYRLPEKPEDYKFTSEEHAAVELSLRDARRRFAIDSNRVYLTGMVHGGNMAWDYGLSHPDELAGVAIVSGLPFKHVFAYNKPNGQLVPFYIVEGGLGPGVEQIVLDMARKMISSNYDITYVDYPSRGQEAITAEVSDILDWASRRVREPYREKFDAVTGRDGDDRFYGVVVRGRDPNFRLDPEAVEATGGNLRPAKIDFSISKLSNLIKVNTTGITQVDIWASPKMFDFTKKLEVRHNGKSVFKDIPQADLKPLLRDLKIRGDRQQTYGLKVQVGGGQNF